MNGMSRIAPTILTTAMLAGGASAAGEDSKIIHDAEYYIIEAQNREQWAKDDQMIDQKLASLREKNS